MDEKSFIFPVDVIQIDADAFRHTDTGIQHQREKSGVAISRTLGKLLLTPCERVSGLHAVHHIIDL